MKDDENFLLFAAHLMWKQLKEREKENDNKSEGKQNHKHRDSGTVPVEISAIIIMYVTLKSEPLEV